VTGPQAPAYRPAPDQLAVIAARYGLGPLAAWRELAGGVVNPVLLLNERGVLRINVRTPDDPKVAKEAWVLARLAGEPPPLSVRVPAVLGADTRRTILPYDYLLLDFLPGRRGGEVWEGGSAAERADLSRQLGAILARLHAQPLPGMDYGGWNPATGALGTHADWRALIAAWAARKLAEIAELGIMPAAQLAGVRAWLTAHAEAVPAAARRVLTHGDFGLWNTMVAPGPAGRGWTITAVFDFEWAQAGPPALDFVPILYDPADPLDPVAFLAAYSAGAPLDPGLLRETHYYQMLYHLELLTAVHRYWGGQSGAPHEAGIARLLAGAPIPGFAAAGYGWPF
jgi:aminoglycoside phosphotransferase (APT) family kinase protein